MNDKLYQKKQRVEKLKGGEILVRLFKAVIICVGIGQFSGGVTS